MRKRQTVRKVLKSLSTLYIKPSIKYSLWPQQKLRQRQKEITETERKLKDETKWESEGKWSKKAMIDSVKEEMI